MSEHTHIYEQQLKDVPGTEICSRCGEHPSSHCPWYSDGKHKFGEHEFGSDRICRCGLSKEIYARVQFSHDEYTDQDQQHPYGEDLPPPEWLNVPCRTPKDRHRWITNHIPEKYRWTCGNCAYEVWRNRPSIDRAEPTVVIDPNMPTGTAVLQGITGDRIAAYADPNAPRDPNAPHSLAQHRFDVIDGPAMFEMTHVLYKGDLKYGPDNWRKISTEEHLNRVLAHAYAWLSGDRNTEHLANIMCRAMFAQAKDLRPDYLGKAGE